MDGPTAKIMGGSGPLLQALPQLIPIPCGWTVGYCTGTFLCAVRSGVQTLAKLALICGKGVTALPRPTDLFLGTGRCKKDRPVGRDGRTRCSALSLAPLHPRCGTVRTRPVNFESRTRAGMGCDEGLCWTKHVRTCSWVRAWRFPRKPVTA